MSDPGSPRPVTVVVPVFGDLPSLTACVESLQQNVDQAVHRVLLVNDCGPDADEIEVALLAMTANDTNFFYERNPRNLGFVGNCNRAALELDTTDNDILLLNSDTVTTPGFIEELSAVLHSSPQHGAVCPRSNNATIASLPFKLRDPSVGRDPARTAQVHAALHDVLPRFSVAPVAMGFCLLIRRELIREYGLFDEAFAPGYGEENDFCLRVGRHGYLSLIAHHALVFHMGGRSFVGARREALRSAHEKVIVSRYPEYTSAVRAYINQERDPVDVFADAMVPGDQVVRVLIDLDFTTEPSEWWRYLLRTALKADDAERATFTVSVPDASAAVLARSLQGLRFVRQSRLDGQWDIALVGGTRVTETQKQRLNRTSLRWIVIDELAESIDFADEVVDSLFITPEAVIHRATGIWGRSPVDIEQLRGRWTSLTSNPNYESGGSGPIESRRVTALRRSEQIAPRLVGALKSVARRLLGRPQR
jgi:GT2 family glycosyltransferase